MYGFFFRWARLGLRWLWWPSTKPLEPLVTGRWPGPCTSPVHTGGVDGLEHGHDGPRAARSHVQIAGRLPGGHIRMRLFAREPHRGVDPQALLRGRSNIVKGL